MKLKFKNNNLQKQHMLLGSRCSLRNDTGLLIFAYGQNIFIGNIDIKLVTKLDCFITEFDPINDIQSVKKISSL